MIEATVLLKDGEKVSFTASDMIQAAVFAERQYYPYEKVDIVRVETPVQQDETKGALPLSSPPEGFHPSGLPFCDRAGDTGSEGYAHESTENDPTVIVAEVNPNVTQDGRKKQAKPGRIKEVKPHE